jgi:glycosyltransferase involved in cell wall biosynthesis
VKICYVCADPGVALSRNNGSARHLRSVVRAFVDADHDVELVASRVEGVDELDVPVYPISAPGITADLLAEAADRPASERAVARALRHILLNPATERALERRLELRRPAFVYERYSPFGAAGAWTCRRHRVPHVLEVNAPLAWEGARHRGQALPEVAAELERAAFDATSRIVAVSDELRDQLVDAGVEPSKIRVVPNGVDAGLFDSRGPVRRPCDGESVIVGFTGSLKPWHGLESLVEAFRLLSTDPRFHLLVVGDGPLAERLAELRGELPGRVTLTGAVPLDDVAAYLRAMDVAVAPYPALERFYFSPLKVLEYMACGCAVVASRIGQLTSLIRHGETGWLVPPGDAVAIAAAIRRLADDPELRRNLGRGAAEDARRAHGWAQRVERIAALVPVAA